MPKNTGFSITGKENNTKPSLKGTLFNFQNKTPFEIQQIREIKQTIMSLFIIPYMSEQWSKLEENICFIERITIKINYLLSLYSENDELILYRDLLLSFETIVMQRIEINNLEKNIKFKDISNVSSIVLKTNIIRLKPEYEIYNLILGKPEPTKGYNHSIVNNIVKLLDIDDISFDNIKNNILKNNNK